MLRRVDLEPDPIFARYHGTQIRPRDVVVFLPNWSSLEWIKVPDSDLSRSESWGQDRQFLVSVMTKPTSAMDHLQVVAAFQAFMGW